MKLHYTQASAGSGKTTSIENDVAVKLENGDLLPSQIMAVTFTKDAAAELKERISQKLLQNGQAGLAIGIMSARVGTIHSVFGQLLTDFAFELGLSPEQRVLDDQDKHQVLSKALDNKLSPEHIKRLNMLSYRFSIEDWRVYILDIIELMRSNNLDSRELVGFAQKSIDDLISKLPNANTSVTEQALRHSIEAAITGAKELIKPTKGVQNSVTDCEAILRQNSMQWKNWLKVSKLKPTKMGLPIFSPAMELGLSILKSPLFREELSEFITLIMDTAANVMVEFAAIKQSNGLVDFIDQEQLALTALSRPAVQKRLKDEISYLIIDEFQDSSPIQLALFSKMSVLVDEVLMVGDAKQAIYGFRGSDPTLSLNVLQHVEAGGGTVNRLPNSWRSRSGLVSLCNDLFSAPFSHLLKPEQVQLTAKRTDTLVSPELGWWVLEYDGRQSKEKTLSALAEGIREHIASGVEVHDKKTKMPRVATWKDIAILCRSRSEVAELAECCAQIGIPVSLERIGLLETPEASLALACLRRLIDAGDSLASAEILTLVTGDGPEKWLQQRVERVDNEASYEWNDSAHPILNRLASIRRYIGLLSTKEALELALLSADVSGVVARWEESSKLTEHRLANLAKLSELVGDYENHCHAHYFAATPSGFILWLKSLEQRFIDQQASNPGDAITLTTYHGSKGLEWPIVICNSLDSRTRVSVYGAKIVDNNTNFDWNHPLCGRSIRFWPNPFPESRGSDVLTQVLQSSPEWTEAEQQSKDEAIQLLYVGMTRTRDQLILPTIGSSNRLGEWLGVLNSDLFPLEDNQICLSDGTLVDVDQKVFKKPDDLISLQNSRTRHWLTSGSANSGNGQKYFRPASAEQAIENAEVQVVHDFGSRIVINGSIEMDQLGNALHHCLALSLSTPDIGESVIQELLTQFVPGKISAEQVINRARGLADWIVTNYPNSMLHTELPFALQLDDGGLRQGAIDLAVETKEGWIVIDHKSNPQPASKWLEIAAEHSGQILAYKDVIEKLSTKPVIGCFIHFSVSGGLVEVLG